MSELAKAYSPAEVEERWYAEWESRGLFNATVNPKKTPYTIVIPPPNITGILTLGHVLNNTLQDIFIRWKRMKGYEACWVPGTDHAGIATQNVVEKAVAAEGTDRHKLGREKFVERVWKWKDLYGSTIITQLKRLGVSCDWERERFTLDDGLSSAVREVFVRLFDKGLVYRGKYIVNWCTFHRTALSDDEVENSEANGKLYHIRYLIEGTKDSVVIATTRPETMLGDSALCFHPKDERYRHLSGKQALLPIVGRRLPIVADEYIDSSFGTGIMKVTPAHDANDFLLGQRHHLQQISVIDEAGRMNESVPKQYEGLDRFECRKQIVKDLEAQGSLVKVEDHAHNLGRCYRCNTVVEPYLSDQWFVRMKPLAKPALKVVQDGTVRFHPERWTKVYEHWMDNIRDWCISRQLWWGHRIPVYYAPDGTYTAATSEEEARKKLGIGPDTQLRQDEDVLDTWFSSWLWPFSTLGWPEDTKDLRYFNPTDTLITGPDIIFFWVARMIMANIEFMRGMPGMDGKPRQKESDLVPFRDVYFTSIIRDAQGRKVSKSLGNSPDPIDVIQEYGSDALRFTITYLAPLGQDVLFSKDKCEIGRNFANKVWNAGRFLLLNKKEIWGDEAMDLNKPSLEHLDLADRWILSRLHATIAEYDTSLEEFRVNDTSKLLYGFVWHDFCDWYVEIAKTRFYGEEPAEVKRALVQRALWIFDQAMRLLHPFMPFITEELWQHLTDRPNDSLVRAAFPAAEKSRIERKTEQDMEFVQNVINALRNIRGENNIPPSRDIELQVIVPKGEKNDILKSYDRYLEKLARVTSLNVISASKKPRIASSAVVDGIEIFVPLEGLIDLDAERGRIEKEIQRVQQMLESIEKKLGNPQFTDRAPREVVDKEREKQATFRSNLEKLKENLGQLSN
ncbi:MAG TPA: valine--tRNA ligase [Bacteroidota bacterium]